MQGVITREDINPVIKFTDYSPYAEGIDKESYTYNDLNKEIDAFKNLLEPKIKKENPTVVIGMQASKEQFACLFACYELGISVSIIDYERADDFDVETYIDPKTDILSPIDYFVVHKADKGPKYEFFKAKAIEEIVLADQKKDYTPNTTIKAKPDTIAIRCTSSGTTNTPKKIEHTHEFLKAVAMRNTSMYYGRFGIGYNLNHGSSMATYFLPCLFSKDTTECKNLRHFKTYKLKPDWGKTIAMDHFMISYKIDTELWAKNHSDPNLNLYTLGPISPEIYGKFKDVISIFGSNETSGPTLLCKLSYYMEGNKKPFFKAQDDFYGYEIIDGRMHVKMPVYNTVHNTQDKFEIIDDKFYFKGRDDLYRINGLEVDKFHFEQLMYKILKGHDKGQIVYDLIRQEIYLAIWHKVNEGKVMKRFNKQLDDEHKITKVASLNMKQFLSGVKVDQELLREHFRNNV